MTPSLRAPASVHSSGMNALCKDVVAHVERLFEEAGAKDPAHNIEHVEAVTEHVRQALDDVKEQCDERRQAVVILAALLHEADDAKLFPAQPDSGINARAVLAKCLPPALSSGTLPGLGLESVASLSDEVVEIIDLVGCRKNKDGAATEGKEWQLIVRDADRIEAVGEVGIARCFAYNQKVGAPLFVASTPRPLSEEEVWNIATPERFAAYSGESASMVDHYYDKLLHLQRCGSGNRYLENQLKARLQVMVDFVLEFSRTGEVDVPALEALQAKHCSKRSSTVARGEKRQAESVPDVAII